MALFLAALLVDFLAAVPERPRDFLADFFRADFFTLDFEAADFFLLTLDDFADFRRDFFLAVFALAFAFTLVLDVAFALAAIATPPRPMVHQSLVGSRLCGGFASAAHSP